MTRTSDIGNPMKYKAIPVTSVLTYSAYLSTSGATTSVQKEEKTSWPLWLACSLSNQSIIQRVWQHWLTTHAHKKKRQSLHKPQSISFLFFILFKGGAVLGLVGSCLKAQVCSQWWPLCAGPNGSNSIHRQGSNGNKRSHPLQKVAMCRIDDALSNHTILSSTV